MSPKRNGVQTDSVFVLPSMFDFAANAPSPSKARKRGRSLATCKRACERVALFKSYKKHLLDKLKSARYNDIEKVGGIMKKIISLILFILAVAVFIFELYFSIAGAVNVNNRLAELAARGASGHEYLGVGLDILVFGVILISIVGLVLAIISWKIAQYRAVRIVSGVLCPMFLLPIFVSAVILTFR